MEKTGTTAADDRKRELFRSQKQLLDTFLEHGAISRAQYDKSLGDLTVKMGMADPPGRPEEGSGPPDSAEKA